MKNEFELKTRAISAFWQNISEGAFKAIHEPSFSASYAEEDLNSGRIYVVLRSQYGATVKVYRYNANRQLKSLSRVPKFMRSNGQVSPIY
jgi:hypothetical protein